MKVLNASRVLSLVAAAGLLVFTAAAADAAGQTASKQEKKLDVGIQMLNKQAELPQAGQVLTKKFNEEFKVKSDEISSLRSKGLDYGEITAVLAIADKMDGGATEENINKVMSMQKGKTTNWNQIAKSVNVDFEDVADRVSSFEDDAHDSIKQAAIEGTAGRAAGGESGGMSGGAAEDSGGAAGGTGEEQPGGTTDGSTGGGY